VARTASTSTQRTMDGRTPLSWAADKGYEEVVSCCGTDGVDVDSKDNDGRTPLSWAADKGTSRGGRRKDGVDVTPRRTGKSRCGRRCRGPRGTGTSRWSSCCWPRTVSTWTPWRTLNTKTRAVVGRRGGTRAVVRLLLAKDGVDVDSQGQIQTDAAVTFAAENGHKSVVKLLRSRDGPFQ
jgi:hypothetical protein